MRILEVIKGLGLGGAERALVDRLTAGSDFRYELLNTAPSVDALEMECIGVDVTVTHAHGVRDLRRRLERCDFDILNVHTPSVALQVKLLTASRPYGFVETIHGIRYERRVVSIASAISASVPDRCVAVSKAVAEAALCRLGRVQVIHQGIDIANIQKNSASARQLWRERLQVDGKIVISKVARLSPAKNHRALCDELRRRATDLQAANVVVLFAGDGPLRCAVEAAARDLIELGLVRMLGAVPDAWKVIAASDLTVLASTAEGLPITLMEAVACGVPAIVPRVGGVPEIVRSGSGCLYPRGDMGALVDHMINLARRDAVRARLGRETAKSAPYWSCTRARDDFESLYMSLVP